MLRLTIHAVTLGAALAFWPDGLNGQRTTEALAEALEQIRARRLDSAITLLQEITGSPDADSSQRAEAFLWLGVASFYKGQDAAAGGAFRAALDINALLTPAGILAKLDTGLAALWEAEQTRALCGEALPAWLWALNPSSTADPLNAQARDGDVPEITSGPSMWYPDNLRQAGIQGRVLVRAIIDTLGRAERGSVRIVWTAHRDFNRAVIDYTERAHFRVGASRAGRARSCIVLPVDFKIKR